MRDRASVSALLFADLDGTLIDRTQTDHGYLNELFADLGHLGVSVVPTTALPPGDAVAVLPADFAGYIASLNGALIVRVDESGATTPLSERILDNSHDELKFAIAERAASVNGIAIAFTGSKDNFALVVGGTLEEGRNIEELAAGRPVRLLEIDKWAAEVSRCEAVLGMSLLAPRCAVSLKDLGSTSVQNFRVFNYLELRPIAGFDSWEWFEFVHPSSSKGTAVDVVLGHLGLSESSFILGVGDGDNDVELFQRADFSICVSAGSASALNAADEVLDATAGEALCQALPALIKRVLSTR